VLIYFDDLGWAETSVEMIEGREDIESKESMDLAMQYAADEDIAAESKETAAKIAEKLGIQRPSRAERRK